MEVVNAIGRRKAAIARVYVSEGNGKITVNRRELSDYFPSPILQFVVKQPLIAALTYRVVGSLNDVIPVLEALTDERKPER